MPPTSLPGAIADEVVTLLEAPGTANAIEAKIQAGETSLETLVTNAVKNLPKSNNVFVEAVLGPVEGYAGTVAAAIVAKYPSTMIYAWLLALAKQEATALGG